MIFYWEYFGRLSTKCTLIHLSYSLFYYSGIPAEQSIRNEWTFQCRYCRRQSQERKQRQFATSVTLALFTPIILFFIIIIILLFCFVLLLFYYCLFNHNLKTGCCFCCCRLVLFAGIKFWRQCRIDKQRSIQHWTGRQFWTTIFAGAQQSVSTHWTKWSSISRSRP